jgi:hypothetical protein
MTQRSNIFFISLFCFHGIGLGQQAEYDAAVIKYIVTYGQIAVREMKIYRIPASITLAQGIFESNAGRSKLAVEANNHFGIKCHKEWTGEKYYQDDETKNECFRKYDNPEESFRDHSWFLSQRDRYKSLFSLDIRDYKGWAVGLKVAGYATNPKYAELLIKAIENYELFKFDDPGYNSVFIDSVQIVMDTALPKPKTPLAVVLSEGPKKHTIFTINNLKLTIALKGDTWNEISRLFDISERKLYKYNDLKKGARMVSGQMVYLEKKRKKGAASWHIVKPGETMYTISQQNGIQLKKLYKLNSMKPGSPVKQGKKLLLR